ncbi:MAG: restriction endonuclease [Candidatus Thiodiazotropha sp. (ex Ctena orbiculata)]|nr:restriction endonuclease [Candidatus Thiodiazotropha taylori]
MGGIWFDPEVLSDSLSETAGYKSGLALSIEAMCDHLSDTPYADLLRESETEIVRIRSEDYDDLFYKLLHRIGYTTVEFDGDVTGIGLFHKYKGTELEKTHEGVVELFVQTWPGIMQQTQETGGKSLDPEPFMRAAFEKYGHEGLAMAYERLLVLDRGIKLRPHSGQRYREWRNIEELESLFKGGSGDPEVGVFIDQRFINYLYANHGKIIEMHWRKFEELTAEYFQREGFNVELGPGTNDDGVDVRVWKEGQDKNIDAPHIIIQCKRQKHKVEKVVVKGLYADMLFQKAELGLIATTSELSPGAKQTLVTRGYSIEEVDNIGLQKWLETLQTPGTGIVRV